MHRQDRHVDGKSVITLVLHTDIEGKDSEKVLFYAFLSSYLKKRTEEPASRRGCTQIQAIGR